jgi:hypothetical protein
MEINMDGCAIMTKENSKKLTGIEKKVSPRKKMRFNPIEIKPNLMESKIEKCVVIT